MKLIVKDSPGRIQIIDGLRGLSIVLMVAYHFGFDLVTFCGMPRWVLYNPLLNTLQPFFAGLFIVMSGISCRFSKNNLRRGIEMLLAGGVITLATLALDYIQGGNSGVTVWFGILHFLGVAAIIYALIGRFFGKIPPVIQIVLYIALYFVSAALTRDWVAVKGLWWLGFVYPGFSSADFFPVLPWIFVYLTGTVLGKFIVERKFPAWFYTAKMPFFSAVGRNTIIVYLLHQPVLYGVTQIIRLLQP